MWNAAEFLTWMVQKVAKIVFLPHVNFRGTKGTKIGHTISTMEGQSVVKDLKMILERPQKSSV